ncbi:12-oxophytodienoate reductase [Sphingomonas profundi]|uniref:oxidoreductase n=1 Tax=Alterirhizorhabdus profundi TaxID=2681549 RepID=UPI001E63A387|nr:12-oxophytodienoate reductase [Sphingomonas profundi]
MAMPLDAAGVSREEAMAGLFTPFRLRQLVLPNRIVMAPMGRCFATDGVLADGYADYFRKRVEGGVGLILGEASSVADEGSSNPTSPRFYGDAALEAWRAPIAAVHAAGGAFMPQIWHAGLARAPGTDPFPDLPSIGPSDWYIPNTDEQLRPRPGHVYGNPMSESQIADVIARFGEAAAHAQRLGADGVEIHGAHGYLIDQFFWPTMNRRTDDYNGSLRDRTRFGAEVVREIRRRTGADFPILFRFSQWKLQDYDARTVNSPEEVADLVEPLAEAGVDLFHVSVRRFWEAAFTGSDLTLSGWTRKLSGLPTMTVGSITLDQPFGVGTDDYAEHFTKADASQHLDFSRPASMDRVLDLFAKGEFDLIAIGRALLSNPDWARIVREGRFHDLKPYSRDVLGSLA